MEQYLESKSGFWWLLFKEILYTYSNKPSFFASKRIERSVMFNIAMWIVVGYTIRNWSAMTTTDVSVLTGILLVGGGFNAVQIRRDQQAKKQEEQVG
jgi:hypothetical protein